MDAPSTHNFPVDELGRPDFDASKIHTAERNFRLTPTEQEYFVLRKMREEQRIKGNVDLAEQLTKVSFVSIFINFNVLFLAIFRRRIAPNGRRIRDRPRRSRGRSCCKF